MTNPALELLASYAARIKALEKDRQRIDAVLETLRARAAEIERREGILPPGTPAGPAEPPENFGE